VEDGSEERGVKNRKIVLVTALFALVLLLSCENATNGESSAPPFDLSASFAAPVLEAGDSAITVNWEAVMGADAYSVYYGKVSNGIGRVQYGPDVADSGVTIRGLVNLHTYYVWVRAKDADGYYVESGAASLFLLERISQALVVELTGNKDVPLPHGLVGNFGYISIDDRSAVLITGNGYRWEAVWNFYSLDQPRQ
jgi:hypothetical protein